ncbi:cystathionine beta-lyase [SAR116 cluster alpha proteobacterium HIMB100]|nr:cystathionine beta-lyase [SAR116 cluster alpha proteobacterium HIMB100]
MAKNLSNIQDVLVEMGRPRRIEGRHVNLPIELGSTMVFDSLSAFEEARDKRYQSGTMYYGRYGNEASFQFESVLAELEGAAGVTLTSSGVAAISMTLSTVTKPGDHLLVADHVYGNTRNFCDVVLASRGVEIEYFDPMIGAKIGGLFRKNTVAIMFEAPGSGTFEFPDIRAIVSAAKPNNVKTIIDGTWFAACFCRPLELGVDVVLYSISKYICGHSDAMMGAVACADQSLDEQIRKFTMAYGDKTGSQEVFLALRGIRTLAMRMEQADKAGREIARWLKEQPQVKRILHPAFADCPGHEYWKRDCTGAAGLFGVIFHPCSDQQIRAFVDKLHYFGIGVSWGGYESLVLPVKPVRTASTWREDGQLVRFNIGFENIDSLKSDLKDALPLLGQ